MVTFYVSDNITRKILTLLREITLNYGPLCREVLVNVEIFEITFLLIECRWQNHEVFCSNFQVVTDVPTLGHFVISNLSDQFIKLSNVVVFASFSLLIQNEVHLWHRLLIDF